MTQDMTDGSMTLMKRLKEPFPRKRIHWRVGATTNDKTKGIALAYIDARDVMARLDDVMGVGGWQCDYPFPGCCKIGLKLDEWVWKANGAGETEYEGAKGQFSDAFKRAAVLWGVGRYLYYLPTEWVPIESAGKSYKISKEPQLPAWALPGYVPRMNQELKNKYIVELREALSKCDDTTIRELVRELDADQHNYVMRELKSDERGFITNILKGE